MDLDTNRNYLLKKLTSRAVKASDFDYDRLQAPPLWQFIRYDDIERLRKLATSLKYSAKPVEKLQEINRIMVERGFKKVTGGTNRVIYKHLEYDPVLFKVAFDATGINDSPREYENQFYYKPFVSKVFEVSPCGAIEEVEKGIPITSRAEFLSIADDVYDVIRNWFIGERVMDDIGTDYFMNWALRPGFGPILIDFPYSYKLDGNKLYCNADLDDGSKCGGMIDYDDGFNHLMCTKCGAKYKAIDLEKAVDDGIIIQRGSKRRSTSMKVVFGRGDDVRENFGDPYYDPVEEMAARVIRPPRTGKPSKIGKLKVTVRGGSVGRRKDVTPKNEEPPKNYRVKAGKVPVSEPKIEDDTVATPKEPTVKVTAERKPVDQKNMNAVAVPRNTDPFMEMWDGKVDEKTYKMIEHSIRYPVETNDGHGVMFEYEEQTFYGIVDLVREENCYWALVCDSEFTESKSDNYEAGDGELSYRDLPDLFLTFLIENGFTPLHISSVSAVPASFVLEKLRENESEDDEDMGDEDTIDTPIGEAKITPEETEVKIYDQKTDDEVPEDKKEDGPSDCPSFISLIADEISKKPEYTTTCAVRLIGDSNYYATGAVLDPKTILVSMYDSEMNLTESEVFQTNEDNVIISMTSFANLLYHLMRTKTTIDLGSIREYKFVDPSIFERKEEPKEDSSEEVELRKKMEASEYREYVMDDGLGLRLIMSDERKLYILLNLSWKYQSYNLFLYSPNNACLDHVLDAPIGGNSVEYIPSILINYFKISMYARLDEIKSFEFVDPLDLFDNREDSAEQDPQESFCALNAEAVDADTLEERFGIANMKEKLGTTKAFCLGGKNVAFKVPMFVTSINDEPLDQFIIMKKDACTAILTENNHLKAKVVELEGKYAQLLVDAAAEQDKVVDKPTEESEAQENPQEETVFKTEGNFIPPVSKPEKPEEDNPASDIPNESAAAGVPVGAIPPDVKDVSGFSQKSFQKYPPNKGKKNNNYNNQGKGGSKNRKGNKRGR